MGRGAFAFAVTGLAIALGVACSPDPGSLTNGEPPGPVGDFDSGAPTDGSAQRDGTVVDAPGPPVDAGHDSPPPSGGLTPPAGGSSAGSGGTVAPGSAAQTQAGAVTFRLIVPAAYAPSSPTPLLVVFSGTEGGQTMMQNLVSLGPSTGTDGFLRAVLDGVAYNGDGPAGATVLDEVRAKYNVDNDRTYLLGESAGTTAALMLGFHLRESYFAAYWANDVNASDAPAQTAAALGFAPNGQAGPGGASTQAQAIVANMQAAGYRVPTPAPYDGPGSTQHGNPQQFIAAISWFPGKTRQ